MKLSVIGMLSLPTLPLRFVCSDTTYSEYVSADGEEVYLAHGTGQRLVHFVDLDLDAVASHYGYPTGEEFRELVASLILDPDDALDLRFCDDCASCTGEDELHGVASGDAVCEDCLSNYWWCEHCEEYYSSTRTVGSIEVCEDCLANYYTWCETCYEYFPDEDSYEHDHDTSCQCEAPAQSFTIRNDGEAPLTNDTPVTISLAAGIISDEGINAIRWLLRNASWNADAPDNDKLRQVAYELDELGPKWQTREGNYTKRLSRFAYKRYALKLSAEIVSQVGCIARDHSSAVDFEIEITRNLNLPAEDFAHEDSCWWQSYASSRCALKNNGGFGLRTFSASEYAYRQVTGRAWVMPMRLKDEGTLPGLELGLTPTFDTLTADAFVVFNGYGDLSGYAATRILSHMTGMTYRKISFSCDPMYVNNGAGYLVAPEDIASRYTDGSLALVVDDHANLYNREMRTLTHA